MSIIIPAGIDQDQVRIPMEFPLRADADTVMDNNGKTVMTIDSSIAIGEAIKFSKLFAKAPEMWELLGDCYVTLSLVARNSEGMDHGTEEELDKEQCLLCRLEGLLGSIK